MKGIEKRGENSYRFVVFTGVDAKGRYNRKTKTYRITKKMTPKQQEEHLKLEYLKFKQEVLSGEYITPEKMTFLKFSVEWLKKYAEKELAETTYVSREYSLNNHILPIIGHASMDSINTLMLMDLMGNLTRKDGKDGDLSTSSKEDIYKTLNSLFKYAVNWKVISVNPMVGVNKPKNRQGDIVESISVYEPEEVAKIMLATQNEPYHWSIFISLALTGGLRRGELLGLEWSKVDFINNRIDVSTTIVKGRSGPVIKSPKSQASKRLVALSPDVMEELKKYRIHWVKEKLSMGDRWVEDKKEWLFCNENGKHFYPDSPTDWWHKFTERYKIRHISLHGLRHTSASILIARDVHSKVISERLGHSKIGVTIDRYGHLMRSSDPAAAEKLSGIILPRLNVQE